MSRYTEYYKTMSLEMKSWRSAVSCLHSKIRRLKIRLASDLEGHYSGRIYTAKTQAKINKLESLKRQYEALKSNRPEPKKSTAPRTRTKSKIVKKYTTAELWGRFNNLSKDRKLEILYRILNITFLEGEKLEAIIESMGYTKKESEWVKS